MSLKETLGLRSHREDPKMFWFEMTLLCLLLSLVSALLSLCKFPGVPGLVIQIAGRLGLSLALVCAVLTEAISFRKKTAPVYSQVQLENGLLALAAALAFLQQLLRLFPNATPTAPVVFAGIAAYFIARIASPRLRRKEAFATREILLILACGVLIFVLLAPFLDMAWAVLSAL